MENVKGILTKEKGRIRERILNEIRSIIDVKEFPKFLQFCAGLNKGQSPNDVFFMDCLLQRFELEVFRGQELFEKKAAFIQGIEAKFRQILPNLVDYKTSKTNSDIATIRHGFRLLLRSKMLRKNWIMKRLI